MQAAPSPAGVRTKDESGVVPGTSVRGVQPGHPGHRHAALSLGGRAQGGRGDDSRLPEPAGCDRVSCVDSGPRTAECRVGTRTAWGIRILLSLTSTAASSPRQLCLPRLCEASNLAKEKATKHGEGVLSPPHVPCAHGTAPRQRLAPRLPAIQKVV